MNLTFNGLNEVVATFNCPSQIQVGDVVTLIANDTVSKAAANNELIGTCVSKNGVIVGVMLHGVAELDYTGTAPTLGYNKLLTDGSNKIKIEETGRPCLVLSVNTANLKATILL